ncbi:response regulator [Paenibacillus cymbidii]|uniref:response regulator n=1 Tax=Paenibacillus cymbidii TaxID=1639034 RepID=UPI001081E91E|nr:response regulator [Paenibacillus cymbidii]
MFAVMLVEDEQVLREGMRQFIPWEDYGFRVAAEAGNGLEALERLDAEPIDLIFLDLHMPRMSGLDFMQRLAERRHDALVAVITGYNEFEYARTALKHNVLDYLLKPLQMNEVAELLEKARRQLDGKGTAEAQAEAELFKIVNRLHAERAGQEWLQATMQRYRDYAVQYALLATGTRGKGAAERVKETARAALSGGGSGNGGILWAAEYRDFGYLLVLLWKGSGNGADEAMEKAAEEDGDVECVLTSPRMPIAALPAMIRRLQDAEAMMEAVFYADNKVMRSDRLPGNPPAPGTAGALPPIQPVLHALEQRDKGGLQREMSELYFRLRTGGRQPADRVRALYAELVVQAHLLMEKTVGQGSLTLQRQTTDRQLQAHLTLRAVHDCACRSLLGLLVRLEDAQHQKKRRIIVEIKRYVEEHMAEPILLSAFAEANYVTSEYLSFLFKKEEGVNFNQYLKEVRVRQAAKLFRENYTLKIYEAAGKVGYQDAKHFSKVFKEVTGFTPKEFVDRLSSDEQGPANS